jgi:sugar phosphate isomerase/epimerase
MLTRRTFLQSASAAFVGTALSPSALLSQTSKTEKPLDVSIFTKHLLGLPYEQLGEIVASLGISGVEAPIRPGGHVEPAKVEDELPKLVDALRKHGIRITMLTTGINSGSEATRTETVLRTAKGLGIQNYRMNWYTYDVTKPIWPQLDEIRPKLRDLVQLSKEIGIRPCYQNHSGARNVGAGIWDMSLLMRDYKREELAWCFDIMHATIEGSSSWPAEVSLVRDQIGMAFFKNFSWEGKTHRPAALGEGIVSKSYVEQLKRQGYDGPVCLHVEHLTGGVKDSGYLPKAIEATRLDLAILREWWA